MQCQHEQNDRLMETDGIIRDFVDGYVFKQATSGAGGELHHPTILRSINLSQPSRQLTNTDTTHLHDICSQKLTVRLINYVLK